MKTPPTYLSPSSQTQFHSLIPKSLTLSPNGNEKACLFKLHLQPEFFLRERLDFLSRHMQSALSKSKSLKTLWSKIFLMVKMDSWSETNISENNSKFGLANMLVGSRFGWQWVLVSVMCDSQTYANETRVWGLQTCTEHLQHLGDGPGQLRSTCSVLLLVCGHCSCFWWHHLNEPAGAVRLARISWSSGCFLALFAEVLARCSSFLHAALSPVPSACLVAVTLQRDRGWVKSQGQHVYSNSLVLPNILEHYTQQSYQVNN